MSDVTNLELIVLLKHGSKSNAIQAWLKKSDPELTTEESVIVRRFIAESFAKAYPSESR